MGEKSHYNYRVEPQDVDFTLRATIPSLGSAILNTAGIDAHGKGFGAVSYTHLTLPTNREV